MPAGIHQLSSDLDHSQSKISSFLLGCHTRLQNCTKKKFFHTKIYLGVPYIVSLCLFLANIMFPLKYLPRVLFGDSATLISIVVGGGTGAASTVHFALLRFIGSSAMSQFIEADLKPFTELDKHFGICTINFFLSILLADMNLPCANNMKYRWNSSSAFSSDFHRYFSNSTIIETPEHFC